MKNHTSLDQMSDPQLTKHFFGVILQKIWWRIFVMPFAATSLYALIVPFLFSRPLVGLDYFYDCSRRCFVADYLSPI